MKTPLALVASLFLALPVLCRAQIVQLDLPTVLSWQTCTVQSSPFQSNATFMGQLDSGSVAVTTAGYFSGQSHTDRGLITSSGSALSLDFNSPGTPGFDGWNWISRYYAVGFPDYIRGPNVLSDYLKAGEGVSFLFSEMVSGFSIDVTFAPLINSTAATGAYRVFAFGNDGSLLGSIASTHTSSNYLDPSTWENLSLQTANLADSIRGITVVRDFGTGVFIDSSSIRLAGTGKFAAVPEPSAFLPAGIAVLGLLIYRRMRKR